jgi:hypothetical protein
MAADSTPREGEAPSAKLFLTNAFLSTQPVAARQFVTDHQLYEFAFSLCAFALNGALYVSSVPGLRCQNGVTKSRRAG